jgi:hypothetical protein
VDLKHPFGRDYRVARQDAVRVALIFGDLTPADRATTVAIRGADHRGAAD